MIKRAQVLEVSLERLVFGKQRQEQPVFEIKNKRLKELCKQADRLKPDVQDVICRFMDMATKQDKLKRTIR